MIHRWLRERWYRCGVGLVKGLVSVAITAGLAVSASGQEVSAAPATDAAVTQTSPRSTHPGEPSAAVGTHLRQPGAAGLVEELVPAGEHAIYWRSTTNRFRGVVVLLERDSGGLMATRDLREDFSAQGWASLLVLVDPGALSIAELRKRLEPALSEARRRAASGGSSRGNRVVLAASRGLGEWAVQVASDLQVDGLLLRNLPHMMGARVARERKSNGDEGRVAVQDELGIQLRSLTQNVLLIQERRPPWWVAPEGLPLTQEWQLTNAAARSPKWLARRLRGWQQRLARNR